MVSKTKWGQSYVQKLIFLFQVRCMKSHTVITQSPICTCKVFPLQARCGPDMTAALEGSDWSAARPGRTLPPEKTRYAFHRRLCRSQGRSGRAENLVPTWIRSRSFQPVAIPTELPGPQYA